MISTHCSLFPAHYSLHNSLYSVSLALVLVRYQDSYQMSGRQRNSLTPFTSLIAFLLRHFLICGDIQVLNFLLCKTRLLHLSVATSKKGPVGDINTQCNSIYLHHQQQLSCTTTSSRWPGTAPGNVLL